MFRDRLQCLGTALAQGVAGSGTHREQWLPVLMARGCAKERMCCVSGGGRYGTVLLTQQQGLSVEPPARLHLFPCPRGAAACHFAGMSHRSHKEANLFLC